MASPAMNPAGSGAPPQGQAPAGASGDPQGAQKAIADFRNLAEMIQKLAGDYPEFTEAAAGFLPQLQKVMAKVAGNPQRTPDRQAPPQGA